MSPSRVLPRVLPLALLLAAPLATAAPFDPTNQRFERIGYSVGDVAAVLRYPGEMRAIVFTRGGEIHRVAGDRLVDELMGTVSVSQTCAGDGLLGAAWDTRTLDALFVTYIAPGTTRKFTVARLPIGADGVTLGAPEILQQVNVPATAGCTNLGGGITLDGDGHLLVGVGDMGNGPGAGQQSVLTGKILRIKSSLPAGPAPGNPSASSAVYNLGVRHPVRLAYDAGRNMTWFLDVGPGSNDELNFITGPSMNFAWPRATGEFATNGFQDPAWTWTTAINPTDLAIDNGANFGFGAIGDLIVSGAGGFMDRIRPVDLAAFPPVANETPLVIAGSGDPNAFADVWMPDDGFAYVSTPNGEMFRLRTERGIVQEPSDNESITPLLVSKLPGGGLRLTVETETAVSRYGFYPGDLTAFPSYYGIVPPLQKPADCAETTGATLGCLTGTPGLESAWTTIDLTPAQVSAMAPKAYFALSALSTRNESLVGHDSTGWPIPGGNQQFGCPCPVGTPVGPDVGQCATSVTLAEGIAGRTPTGYNVVGPMNFPADGECLVQYFEVSMEWCPPCRAMAADAEALWQNYAGRDFLMIHVLPEDYNYVGTTNPGRIDVAQRWTSDFGLTFPVYADHNYYVWNLYDLSGAIPQSYIVGKDGVVTDYFLGYTAPNVLEAAIDRDLAQ